MKLTQQEQNETGSEFAAPAVKWSAETLNKIREAIEGHNNRSFREVNNSLGGLYCDVLNIEIDKLRKKIKEEFYGSEVRFGIPDMIKKVCDYYGVEVTIVDDVSRRRVVVEPRQLIHWMLRNRVVENSLSLVAIGQITGGQDHGTVIHSCKTVEDRIRFEKDFREDVMMLVNALGVSVRFNGHQLIFDKLPR